MSIRKTKRTRPGASAATDAAVQSVVFAPVQREPAYNKVSADIEAKILSRTLQAGDVLPSEADLARQFLVHRSTVREALRRLESAGLITRPPGAKRMIISRPHTAKVASGMRHALLLHDVTFVDVWEAMRILEPEVAALAAGRRTDEDLRTLTEVTTAFRASQQGDPRSVELVVEFFQHLGAAARNQVLVLAKHSLSQVLAPSLARMIDEVPQARTRIAEAQRKILQAVQARDANEARKWMDKHVLDFKRGYEVAGISPTTPISS